MTIVVALHYFDDVKVMFLTLLPIKLTIVLCFCIGFVYYLFSASSKLIYFASPLIVASSFKALCDVLLLYFDLIYVMLNPTLEEAFCSAIYNSNRAQCPIKASVLHLFIFICIACLITLIFVCLTCFFVVSFYFSTMFVRESRSNFGSNLKMYKVVNFLLCSMTVIHILHIIFILLANLTLNNRGGLYQQIRRFLHINFVADVISFLLSTLLQLCLMVDSEQKPMRIVSAIIVSIFDMKTLAQMIADLRKNGETFITILPLIFIIQTTVMVCFCALLRRQSKAPV